MSATAEPGRHRPYDKDLHWRVIYQWMEMNLTYNRNASNSNVSPATCQRLYMKFVQTGTVNPVKLTEEMCEDWVSTRSYTLLEWYWMSHLRILVSCVNRYRVILVWWCLLQLLVGYWSAMAWPEGRFAKLQGSAATLSEALLWPSPSCLVVMFGWVDETGADSRDHIREYGYSLQGMTPESKRLLAWGERTNAVGGLTSSGIIASTIADNHEWWYVLRFCSW